MRFTETDLEKVVDQIESNGDQATTENGTVYLVSSSGHQYELAEFEIEFQLKRANEE